MVIYSLLSLQLTTPSTLMVYRIRPEDKKESSPRTSEEIDYVPMWPLSLRSRSESNFRACSSLLPTNLQQPVVHSQASHRDH